jgi:ABC-type multidrug transport system ATPase subunit
MTDVDNGGENAPARAGTAGGESASIVARTDGLGVHFGDVSVFDDVNIAFEAGEVLAVVGPNGSGKSTLLRTLAGLQVPTNGRVRVARHDDRPVGFCPQNPRFRAQFTVRETLAFYADLLDGDVSVDDTISLVGLDAVADRRVDALSGGMIRLLGMAQAVLGDPGLLVLDEPASGLDPSLRSHIFEVIGDLAATGPGVVVATHHLTGAERSDRVAVLNDGGIVADDEPSALVAALDASTSDGIDSLEAAFRELVGDELAVSAGREVES